MPPPNSKRGNAVTTADFQAPFTTPIFPFGNGGIDLASSIDAIAVGRYSRMLNCLFGPTQGREITGRPGQTVQATTAAGSAHSISRLIDVQAGGDERFVVGTGTSLYHGASGALANIDSGYSGNPLTMVPLRPPLSGDPWVYIGDSSRMRKVRFDGLDLPIGLPAPGGAASVALGTVQFTNIAKGTATGDAWTSNKGQDYSSPPLVANAGSVTIGGDGTVFLTNPGSAVLDANQGYWNFWGMTRAINMNKCGTRDATDDDVIYLDFKFGNPAIVQEARIYFVCSTSFSASVLPGTKDSVNQDFYMKAFRPDDFAPMVQAAAAQIETAETSRVNQLRERALLIESELQGFRTAQGRNPGSLDRQRIIRNVDAFLAQRDPARSTSVIAGGAISQYIQFGRPGVPLRRGDWKRFGTTTGRDWGTITGIIIYLSTTPNILAGEGLVQLTLINWDFRGGYGPDVLDPAMQSYDYRYTHFDPRTGAESNPSPIMDEANWADPIRGLVNVTPAAFGDGAMRQRIYRRGGALTEDWYFTGTTASDGGVFADEQTDLEIQGAGGVEIDHYQPISTVDDSGNTVLAQPVPILFGPYNGQLLALGDPYRPGFVYASLPNAPDHWPPDLACEVCPSTEELMNGLMYGSQPFVFSRLGLYPIYGNLTGNTGLTAGPSICKHGLAGRWACAIGGGRIWFVATDNVFATTGGPEEPVGNDLWPLFHGEEKFGMLPIDFDHPEDLRLAVFDNELWFGYRDQGDDLRVLVYNIINQQWRPYQFAHPTAALLAGENGLLYMGGQSSGSVYTHEGLSDDGTPISSRMRTGAWDWGQAREEKLFGDQILDMNPNGVDVSVINFLNNETVQNAALTTGGYVGRARVVLDGFGIKPQRARNIAVDLSWENPTNSTPPVFYFLGTAITMQPDITINRVTNWDDLGHPDPKYVMGVTFDCDTGGQDRTILVEGDWNGVIFTMATLIVNTDGRHKVAFTWSGQRANQVRIRPVNDCGPWILYRADWNSQPEPPMIPGWDIYFENGWDQYYTGLDLFCDTLGQTKRIAVQVDGVDLLNPETGNPWWNIQANGRQVVHLTLPTGRGHVFRFYAIEIDTQVGQLFQFRWHLKDEPSEQANWNAPYDIYGTPSDKYLKALVFEVDTFGQDKTVNIEADGVVVDTLTVNTDGRKVVQLPLTTGQALGRVWRVIPVDANPSRLYSLQPLFDQEPFALTRWETQLTDHGFDGYHVLFDGMITIKSNADVTLTITGQYNQEDGATWTDTYVIPSTGGEKRKRFVPFNARKAVLYKYILECDSSFWLYREESYIHAQHWQGGELRQLHPFGNDDLDPTRGMTNASLAAARSGGTA